jgi:hypothetical protein
MKNWLLWVDNFIFILVLGVVAFMDDISKITGLPIPILVLTAGILIILSSAKSFTKLVIFLKSIFSR